MLIGLCEEPKSTFRVDFVARVVLFDKSRQVQQPLIMLSDSAKRKQMASGNLSLTQVQQLRIVLNGGRPVTFTCFGDLDKRI